MNCGGRGAFGYPLITTVGKMLYEITDFSCSRDETASQIKKAHIDTMCVFRDKATGDGGEVDHQLINHLTRVIK